MIELFRFDNSSLVYFSIVDVADRFKVFVFLATTAMVNDVLSVRVAPTVVRFLLIRLRGGLSPALTLSFLFGSCDIAMNVKDFLLSALMVL